MKYNLIFLLTLFFISKLPGQSDSVSIQELSSYWYSGFFSAYTSAIDQNNNDYLYAASNELGLVIFDVSNLENPIPIDTLPRSVFDNQVVTNFCQVGDYLYLSIGAFQGLSTSPPGMAIVDISDPLSPMVKSMWISDEWSNGAPEIVGDEEHAYIGAMDDGIIILDVKDKDTIKFISDLALDLNFPEPPGLFNVPHARGLLLDNDILYVAHDAGGMRVIDISDKVQAFVIDQYMNFELKDKGAPAYNNIAKKGNLIFAAVDYCGVEVIDASDPSNLITKQWLDPWDCDYTNWDGRPGHTNQLELSDDEKYLFVSGAETEFMVYAVHDDGLEFVDSYGEFGDNEVSWGLSLKANIIVLSMINNPIGIPYDSNKGGIKIFLWQDLSASLSEESNFLGLNIYPNPVHDVLNIFHDNTYSHLSAVSIYDANGTMVMQSEISQSQSQISVSNFKTGLYYLQIVTQKGSAWSKFFKID